MYHHFSEGGAIGTSQRALIQQIKVLQEVCHPTTLAQLWRRDSWEAVDGKPLAILTIDDGYNDFFTYAFPLLKACSMPATLFVTVNFLDGKCWLWFDQLRFLLDTTQEKKIVMFFQGEGLTCKLDSHRDKKASWHKLAEYCLLLQEEKKATFLQVVADACNVSLPDKPPMEFSPISWENLAKVADCGIEIGSHTLSHPVLPMLTEKAIYRETVLSKMYLEDKLQRKVESFAYPFGTINDYNKVVVKLVRAAGYSGAVVAHSGLPKRNFLYAVPRLGSSSDMVDFLWKIYGMEYLAMRQRK